MAATVFVTATDPELPGMLRVSFPRSVFTTVDQLRASIQSRPGPLVIVLDAADVDLVNGLTRNDVRAVVLLTPGKVPVVFRRPVVAVVDRPLFAARVTTALRLAVAELGSPKG